MQDETSRHDAPIDVSLHDYAHIIDGYLKSSSSTSAAEGDGRLHGSLDNVLDCSSYR
jgi:hypothetical protein